ncbi:MAG: glycosyltransferase family 2 protein [Alphaproteobacteria bacterium]
MPLADGLAFLSQLDLAGFVVVFWHLVLLELPRYLFAAILVTAASLIQARRPSRPANLSVSVLLPGHNEAANLALAVASIREQTLRHCQIVVVDDGSDDNMAALARRLQRDGLIDVFISTPVRSGKSAAANLGLTYCTGDFVIIADADTTYDRDAFAELLLPFADPRVGAVSGNIGVRNASASLLASWQAVQYLISISLGRRVSDMLDILFIVSGAFGAFRREAILSVGGWDVGPGEDADITVKMRRAGWRIRFAPDAWSLTDVPVSVRGIVNQRLRWNRSMIRIRMRKFRGLFDVRQAQFSVKDAFGTADIVFFQFAMPLSFVGYLFWLFFNYGAFGWVLLMAVSSVYVVLGVLSFVMAAAISGWHGRMSLWPFALSYELFNAYFLRFVALIAYLDELVWRHSYDDDYVPRRVRERTERY